MARAVSDMVRETLTQVVHETIGNLAGEQSQKGKRGALSSVKGVLAGAGLAAAAPLAKKGVDALRDGSLDEMIAELRERVEAGELVGSANGAERSRGDDSDPRGDDAEAAAGDADASDDDEGDEGDDQQRQPSGGPQATGKGRRMPVQQSVDVGVPLETAYNQFTQFEDWPEFMHRVTRVTQPDDCTVSFAAKIWGKTKEFEAQIETQRPDERIKWKVSKGITHTGVVTFHELAPHLTRIEVTLDVDPGSLLEKAARGMRHIKRAVRADLHRYKAFIEMQEHETGAWRGVIIDGELVEPHEDSYDDEREYSELESEESSASADAEEEYDDDEEESEESSASADAEEEYDDDEEESDEDEEAGEAEEPRQRRDKSHGRRRPTIGSNGRGKAEHVGSGGGRRRKSPRFAG